MTTPNTLVITYGTRIVQTIEAPTAREAWRHALHVIRDMARRDGKCARPTWKRTANRDIAECGPFWVTQVYAGARRAPMSEIR